MILSSISRRHHRDSTHTMKTQEKERHEWLYGNLYWILFIINFALDVDYLWQFQVAVYCGSILASNFVCVCVCVCVCMCVCICMYLSIKCDFFVGPMPIFELLLILFILSMIKCVVFMYKHSKFHTYWFPSDIFIVERKKKAIPDVSF